MALNERIKQRRHKLNLTLLEIADYIGVSEATVQRYESGNIKNIKSEIITKLAEILDTTPAYLMGWENDEPELNIPDEFVIMARKYDKVSESDKEKLYKVLDATIDAFITNYRKEGK